MYKFVVVLALAAVCAADSRPAYGPAPAYKAQSYDAPAQYSFNWAVNDGYGSDFGQTETRNGDRTDGSYNVLLPDGRRQTVNYYVDGPSGLIAEVRYDGEARYDDAPAYKPAPVVYKAAPAPVVYKAAPAPRRYKPAPRY